MAPEQRAAPGYSEPANDAGPTDRLLPKTAESSAPLPRTLHSRNNSSASASAGPPAAAAGGSESTPKRPSTLDGQSGLGHGLALGGEGQRPAHRRVASYGEGRQRKAKVPDGGPATEPLSATAVMAATAAAGGGAFAIVGAGAATLSSGQAAAGTAAGRPGAAFGAMQDEDDDFCPTCLEAYTTENPKIFTECGHHFHMPCIYAWLERKDTCPMCESPMQAPGL